MRPQGHDGRLGPFPVGLLQRLLHDAQLERPPLLGRIDLNSPTRIYYVVLGGLLVGAVMLVLFVRRQRRREYPLVDLRMFARPA